MWEYECLRKFLQCWIGKIWFYMMWMQVFTFLVILWPPFHTYFHNWLQLIRKKWINSHFLLAPSSPPGFKGALTNLTSSLHARWVPEDGRPGRCSRRLLLKKIWSERCIKIILPLYFLTSCELAAGGLDITITVMKAGLIEWLAAGDMCGEWPEPRL